MKKENTRRGFTQINKVILNLIQNLQRVSLLFLNNLRGRSRIKYGMTSLCDNGGFTLIELLVVVLIIGILAAVALPQYQFAVKKSEVAKVLAVSKQMMKAQELFYEENGRYATAWSDVIFTVPGRGSARYSSNRYGTKFADYMIDSAGTGMFVYGEDFTFELKGKKVTNGYHKGRNICWAKSSVMDKVCKELTNQTTPQETSGNFRGYKFTSINW